MSNIASPTMFSGLDDQFYDTLDMNQKTGDSNRVKHDNLDAAFKSSPYESEIFDMKVPDRILVVGQNQYYGTTAPPREVLLENAILSPDRETIRVQTPPRVITLNEHYFPTVNDDDELLDRDSGPASERSFSSAPFSKSKVIVPGNQWSSMTAISGSGENSHKGLLPLDELSHLRSQMAKLNRRIMALELDNMQRQQREKYLLALGLGYFLFKFVIWLNK